MAATGTPTPNIGLRIPLGTDPASVDDINYNSNLIDTKLGAVGNDSVQDQIDDLNSKIVVVNKNVTLGESFNSGQMKECIFDISDLKQTYSEVYLMNFAGVSGANYNSFQFCYGYALSTNSYSVGIRNNNTSAQTASSFDVQFLCIK